ncbi:MAG: hypothetical protein JO092_08435, partial [Candidatus Eremiobacteraeota bacterium]|nr:hypothetical protein [Candidatus Eremiobacteraeota bacterium]
MKARIAVFAFAAAISTAGVFPAASQVAIVGGYIYGENRGFAYTPGHSIRLPFYTNSPDGAVHVQVYALSVDAAVAIFRRSAWRLDARDVSAGKPVEAFDSKDRAVDIGALPLGLYGVVARYGGSSYSQLVDVTTLGLVVNGSNDRHSVWSVDLRTFQHHAGPTRVWVSSWSASRAIT